jgi:hypothetical protein
VNPHGWTEADDMNRTIWFLWFQGLAAAPFVIQRCYESWVANNPGWDVVVLDDSNIPHYVHGQREDGDLRALPQVHRSDLIRLELLARYGGVWADATCYCARPLDSWLPAAMASGFFAFERGPRSDRLIGSWFLAASPLNPIVLRMYERLLPYWRDHSFDNKAHPVLLKLLDSRRLGRNRRWTRLWFSRLVRDGLSLTSYYAIHYAFAEAVRTDPHCARIWKETPRISANPPCGLLKQFRPVDLTEDLRRQIDRRSSPVYKLGWYIDVPETSAVRYLMDLEGTETVSQRPI